MNIKLLTMVIGQIAQSFIECIQKWISGKWRLSETKSRIVLAEIC